jgi:hypothetical protein
MEVMVLSRVVVGWIGYLRPPERVLAPLLLSGFMPGWLVPLRSRMIGPPELGGFGSGFAPPMGALLSAPLGRRGSGGVCSFLDGFEPT